MDKSTGNHLWLPSDVPTPGQYSVKRRTTDLRPARASDSQRRASSTASQAVHPEVQPRSAGGGSRLRWLRAGCGRSSPRRRPSALSHLASFTLTSSRMIPAQWHCPRQRKCRAGAEGGRRYRQPALLSMLCPPPPAAPAAARGRCGSRRHRPPRPPQPEAAAGLAATARRARRARPRGTTLLRERRTWWNRTSSNSS